MERFIVENIDASQDNLKVMAFWFTWRPIAEALLRAHNRGVKVRMILDSRSAEPKQKDVHELEMEVIPYFVENGMAQNIRIYSGELLHYKVFMYDNERVINGSCNLFNASLNRHEENYMLMRSPDLYEIFDTQFEEIWRSKCNSVG